MSQTTSDIPGSDLFVIGSSGGLRFWCRKHVLRECFPIYVHKAGKDIPVCEDCFIDGLSEDDLIGGTDDE